MINDILIHICRRLDIKSVIRLGGVNKQYVAAIGRLSAVSYEYKRNIITPCILTKMPAIDLFEYTFDGKNYANYSGAVILDSCFGSTLGTYLENGYGYFLVEIIHRGAKVCVYGFKQAMKLHYLLLQDCINASKIRVDLANKFARDCSGNLKEYISGESFPKKICELFKWT